MTTQLEPSTVNGWAYSANPYGIDPRAEAIKKAEELEKLGYGKAAAATRSTANQNAEYASIYFPKEYTGGLREDIETGIDGKKSIKGSEPPIGVATMPDEVRQQLVTVSEWQTVFVSYELISFRRRLKYTDTKLSYQENVLVGYTDEARQNGHLIARWGESCPDLDEINRRHRVYELYAENLKGAKNAQAVVDAYLDHQAWNKSQRKLRLLKPWYVYGLVAGSIAGLATMMFGVVFWWIIPAVIAGSVAMCLAANRYEKIGYRTGREPRSVSQQDYQNAHSLLAQLKEI